MPIRPFPLLYLLTLLLGCGTPRQSGVPVPFAHLEQQWSLVGVQLCALDWYFRTGAWPRDTAQLFAAADSLVQQDFEHLQLQPFTDSLVLTYTLRPPVQRPPDSRSGKVEFIEKSQWPVDSIAAQYELEVEGELDIGEAKSGQLIFTTINDATVAVGYRFGNERAKSRLVWKKR